MDIVDFLESRVEADSGDVVSATDRQRVQDLGLPDTRDDQGRERTRYAVGLMVSLGWYSTAVDLLQQARQRNTTDRPFLDNLVGLVHVETASYDAARLAFEEARKGVTSDPEIGRVIETNLASLAWRQRDRNNTRHHLARASTFDASMEISVRHYWLARSLDDPLVLATAGQALLTAFEGLRIGESAPTALVMATVVVIGFDAALAVGNGVRADALTDLLERLVLRVALEGRTPESDVVWLRYVLAECHVRRAMTSGDQIEMRVVMAELITAGQQLHPHLALRDADRNVLDLNSAMARLEIARVDDTIEEQQRAVAQLSAAVERARGLHDHDDVQVVVGMVNRASALAGLALNSDQELSETAIDQLEDALDRTLTTQGASPGQEDVLSRAIAVLRSTMISGTSGAVDDGSVAVLTRPNTARRFASGYVSWESGVRAMAGADRVRATARQNGARSLPLLVRGRSTDSEDHRLSSLDVVVIGTHYEPEPGGIGSYVMGMAEYLAERTRSTTVITGLPHPPDGIVEPRSRRPLRTTESDSHRPLTVHRLRHYASPRQTVLARAAYESSFLAHALTVRLPGSPHLIVAVTPSLGGAVAGARLSRRYGSRLLVVVHDLMAMTATQSGMRVSGHRVSAATARLEQWTLSQADEVAVVSEVFRSQLHEYGVPDSRISVVPRWDDTDSAHLDTKQARAALGWRPGGFVVLHAGNIGLKQDLGNMVEAARECLDRPDIRFVIAGDGSQRSAVQSQGAWLPNLEIIDPVESSQYRTLLAAADILVVNERPFADDQSLPSKLASYLTAGRPILAAVSHHGPTSRELALTSGAARRVDPGNPRLFADAVRSLYDNPVERSLMAAAGSEYAERTLGRDASMRRLESAIQECLFRR